MKRKTMKKNEKRSHMQNDNRKEKDRDIVYQPDDFLAEITDCISMIEKNEIDNCWKLLKNIQEDFMASIATDMLLEIRPPSTTIH